MCGIVGNWGFGWDEGARTRALAAIAHRGPDAGTWQEFRTGDQCIQLGHRRLSIIDLSDAANQPFQKDDLAIVYNGEIYNYRELRRELEALGICFRTQSDTEVVLEAFRVWGADALAKLRGMFAFALFDGRTKEMILARDPFGIKPLYIYQNQGCVAFASELHALFAAGVPARVNRDSIASSMLFMFLPEHIPAFHDIEKLPPGGIMRVSDTGVTVTRYWRPEQELASAHAKPLTIEELRAIIEDSVAAHMVADVPVSTFLSGGLDSSIITVLAKRANPALEAYTINFPGEDVAREGMPQDIHFARKLAKSEGIRLNEIEVAPDIVEWLPRMISRIGEPTTDPAMINVMMMCEAARRSGAKVLLSGMGADELFGGYRRHQAIMVAQRYARLPGSMKKSIAASVGAMPLEIAGRALTPVRWAKRFLALAGHDKPQDSYLRSYTYYEEAELGALVPDGGAAAFSAVQRHHENVYNELPNADVPTRMNMTDLHYFLPGLNLTYTDRGSMFASTEVRTPFVDLEMAKAAFRLTGGQKVNASKTKIALKTAAEAWLPHEIIYRPKASFGVPLRAWMKGPLAGRVEDVISNGLIVSEGYISSAVAKTMFEAFRQNRVDYSYQFWHLLALDTWLSWANRPAASI